MVQVCPTGWVAIATEYSSPGWYTSGKVYWPARCGVQGAVAGKGTSFRRTMIRSVRPVLVYPLIGPPTTGPFWRQLTATLLTSAVSVPVPLATVQVCGGALGWAPTVTM